MATSPFSKSICFSQSSANPAFIPRFGSTALETTTPPKKKRKGFLNTDWVNPNIQMEIDQQTPPFPCQLFYHQPTNGNLDTACWQCIRGEILKLQNLEKKGEGSCIGNPCQNLTMVSDSNLPSPQEWCQFAQCVKDHRKECGDSLFYAVFGSDQNAQQFSLSSCLSSSP